MTNRTTEASQLQGEGGGGNGPPPPPAAGPPGTNTNNLHSHANEKVYKSGFLFLSSKGIGWTSWKKRWFKLTRTSLVFFRSDPNAIPLKGGEVNLTLGGIDLNSSGSVVVKEDKKLLTVLFPDGRDGRAFTLKAETLEDLHEWKIALEEALSNAPSAALMMGQNGIFRNDQVNSTDASLEQSKDRQPVKSMVIGRPILLALEDIDGTPSFLEKALKFIEEYGVKVEGILRQAADVDDVEHRIREYEQGKSEFSAEEDAHVIADCVKYVLRELPSSPVPASCCNALLEACRTERGMRVNAMRTAICETFPEPNRRLLQRILMMMQTVASNKAANRMSTSAVAACMAPLLLRPLLAGDCELENDFDMCGDGSMQLLQAAAAANHAQAICILLLEEYESIFGEGSVSADIYSDSEESGTESEELSDDDDDTYEDDEEGDVTEGSDADVDEDYEHASSGSGSEADQSQHITELKLQGSRASNSDLTSSGSSQSGSRSLDVEEVLEANQEQSPKTLSLQHVETHAVQDAVNESGGEKIMQTNGLVEPTGADVSEIPMGQKSRDISDGPPRSVRRPTKWGRTPAKKNLSMESIDLPSEDEGELQKLEDTKRMLQTRIAEEAKENAFLQESLEKRKNALRERRQDLEKDVARLQEQLQKERELRAMLEAGLSTSEGPVPVSTSINEKIKRELDDIAQAEADVVNLSHQADDLGQQLSQQRQENNRLQHDAGNQQQSSNRQAKLKDKQKDIETRAKSHTLERLGRNKHDTQSEKANSEKKLEDLSSSNKPVLQNQQSDSVRNTKPIGVSTGPSSVEPLTARPSSSNFRKSGARAEGSNPTTSALSKLTNRLNFLKERRSQYVNELQNLDKGRNSSQPVQNFERGRGPEPHQTIQNSDKFQGSEGQSSEKSEGSDDHTSRHDSDVENPDYPRRSEGPPNLDRGKSESFPTVEKGRARIPPRTFSR